MSCRKLHYESIKIIYFIVTNTCCIYFYYYGEESIKGGQKYGLSIGDDKSKVYNNLGKFFSEIKSSGDKVFILVKVSESASKLLVTDKGFDVFIEPYFHKNSGEEFKKSDRWVFYLNASSMDIVELRFDNEKLTEIYRNRRFVELP